MKWKGALRCITVWFEISPQDIRVPLGMDDSWIRGLCPLPSDSPGDMLGVPVAPDKVEGPSTVLTFLGICLNTINRLKLVRLQASMCIKREVLSLLGMLHHAAKVADIPEKDFGLTFIGGVCSLAGGMVFK